MKTTNLLTIASFVFGLLIGHYFFPAKHYEFHSGDNGAIMWRCDTRTGVTMRSTFGSGEWQITKETNPN